MTKTPDVASLIRATLAVQSDVVSFIAAMRND